MLAQFGNRILRSAAAQHGVAPRGKPSAMARPSPRVTPVIRIRFAEMAMDRFLQAGEGFRLSILTSIQH